LKECLGSEYMQLYTHTYSHFVTQSISSCFILKEYLGSEYMHSYIQALCNEYSHAAGIKEIYCGRTEPAFLNVYGAPELIPRNEFHQLM
jgi:hypothetical protein